MGQNKKRGIKIRLKNETTYSLAMGIKETRGNISADKIKLFYRPRLS